MFSLRCFILGSILVSFSCVVKFVCMFLSVSSYADVGVVCLWNISAVCLLGVVMVCFGGNLMGDHKSWGLSSGFCVSFLV